MMPKILCGLILLGSPLQAQQIKLPVDRETAWGTPVNDIAPDPAVRYGVLPNGLHYAILRNERPQNTVSVRLAFDVGWIDEGEDELGLAHFIEHMAFNGSTNVPEGEMVKLLEREGLAFGADTNASTGFEDTVYKLDLPRSDPALLDTALMLMRETASELTISSEAVNRERGVLASETRTRNSYSSRRTRDYLHFIAPETVFSKQFRNPKAPEIVANASADTLRDLYRCFYRPDNAVLVVVGDVDTDDIERKIASRFGDWQAADMPIDRVAEGSIALARNAEAANFVDPDTEFLVQIDRLSPYQAPQDTVTDFRRRLLRSLGLSIFNRRLERIKNGSDAPILGGSASVSDLFELADIASVSLQAREGEWRQAIEVGEQELRRAIEFGFTDAELAEQLANFELGFRTAAEQAGARRNAALASGLLAAAKNDRLFVTPQTRLDLFEAFRSDIALSDIDAAFAEAFRDGEPLIHVSSKEPIKGGPSAILAAYKASEIQAVAPPDMSDTAEFGYESFGTPGTVISDRTVEDLGFRELRFANGVRLNLKRTDFEEGRVRYAVRIGSGALAIPDDAIATSMLMSSAMAQAGLGKHSLDELRRIFAGRNVDFGIGSGSDRFGASGSTTMADFAAQMNTTAAYLTDPGYRPEALTRFRALLPPYFARADATPQAVSSFEVPALLTDGNARFGTPAREALEAVTLDDLRNAIDRQFATAPIEIAVVGDIDEAAVIEAVARTFGALPLRENTLGEFREARQAQFTQRRGKVTLTHAGAPDQALAQIYWPLTDDKDAQEEAIVRLLAEVMSLELTDEIRETLGATYSPSASSNMSDTYEGFGTFGASALVAPEDADAVFAAIEEIAMELSRREIDDDLLTRARRPMLERLALSRKENGYWLGLLSEAQLRAERLDRYRTYEARLRAVTPTMLRSAAERWLRHDDALRIKIVHESLAADTAD
ncbi:insulinase family protein [Erythrobacter litoralis]|uniref:M16 family metallopeptidase n=1 Tax=Erythrobacter litoralis TaxID=39960 RepID=UPI0024355ECA|nr:insulinase family protein [Erythrobacter litoralis]MDG6078722.1 insulinase family protein [Erythrobacter litoralis]